MIRFHRSIKLFPGIRLHFSRSGVGVSVGPRGFHVGVTAQNRMYVSAGIPGTGIYARKDFKR